MTEGDTVPAEHDARPPFLALPVHYVHRDGTCRAATVAKVYGTGQRRVTVHVLEPELSHAAFRDAVFGPDGVTGTWHHVDTPGINH